MSGNPEKITEYPVFSYRPQANDIFLAVRDTSSIPTTGTFTYNSLFANVSVNVSFSSNVTANNISTNKLILKVPFTPTTSNNVFGMAGIITWDANNLYVTVSNTIIKRIPLQNI